MRGALWMQEAKSTTRASTIIKEFAKFIIQINEPLPKMYMAEKIIWKNMRGIELFHQISAAALIGNIVTIEQILIGNYPETVETDLINAEKNLLLFWQYFESIHYGSPKLNNVAIKWACVQGYTGLVKLFSDPQFDPSANNNFAIKKAALLGHVGLSNLFSVNSYLSQSAID
jgi:hypothetical protein